MKVVQTFLSLPSVLHENKSKYSKSIDKNEISLENYKVTSIEIESESKEINYIQFTLNSVLSTNKTYYLTLGTPKTNNIIIHSLGNDSITNIIFEKSNNKLIYIYIKLKSKKNIEYGHISSGTVEIMNM